MRSRNTIPFPCSSLFAIRSEPFPLVPFPVGFPGLPHSAAVSFKVNFTKVSGALKQYDIKTEEGTSLLEALKCAGVPIQCRRRVLS